MWVGHSPPLDPSNLLTHEVARHWGVGDGTVHSGTAKSLTNGASGGDRAAPEPVL